MRREGPVTEIGAAQGRIAIWCDEQQARDMLAALPPDDKWASELEAAIERSYPPEGEEE